MSPRKDSLAGSESDVTPGAEFSTIFARGVGDGRMVFAYTKTVGQWKRYNGPSATIGAGAYPEMFTVYYTFELTGTNTGIESLYINGKLQASRTGAVPAVNTTSPFNICSDNGSADWVTGDLFAQGAWSGVLSDADRNALHAWARDKYALDIQATFAGDSLMVGQAATPSWAAGGAAAVATTARGLAPYQWRNKAAGGTGLVNIIAGQWTATDGRSAPAFKYNFYGIWSGSNDIVLVGTSAADCYAKAVQVVQHAIDNGFNRIVYVNTVPRGNSTQQQTIHDYNALLVNISASLTLGSAKVAVVDVHTRCCLTTMT